MGVLDDVQDAWRANAHSQKARFVMCAFRLADAAAGALAGGKGGESGLPARACSDQAAQPSHRLGRREAAAAYSPRFQPRVSE